MQNPKLEPIFKKCWEELIHHRETPNETLHFSQKERGLSYLGGYGDYKEIEEEKAKGILKEWIQEQYNTHGWVYMYTCRDNALISIDMDLDTMDPAEKEMMEYQEGYGEIEFLIGFD